MLPVGSVLIPYGNGEKWPELTRFPRGSGRFGRPKSSTWAATKPSEEFLSKDEIMITVA